MFYPLSNGLASYKLLFQLTMVSVEATSLTFRCDGAGLAARVALHPQHMQSLHLQLTPLPENKEWSADDLQVYSIIEWST